MGVLSVLTLVWEAFKSRRLIGTLLKSGGGVFVALAVLAILIGAWRWDRASHGNQRFRDGVEQERERTAEDARQKDLELFRLAERESMRNRELARMQAERDTMLRSFEDALRDDPNAGSRLPSPDDLRELRELYNTAR